MAAGGASTVAQPAKELKVAADLAEVERVRRFLRKNLHGLALSDEEAMKLELAAHEIFVNIAMYAYPKGRGDVAVRIWRDDGTLFMEFRDRGIPFDPADQKDPDLETHIRMGKRGGLGVFLFKTLMDGYSYTRTRGENILTIFKKVPA